jgi:hypothetical protein
MERTEIIETSLGELVFALTEEAAAYIEDPKTVYKVVGFMVTHLRTGHMRKGDRPQRVQRTEIVFRSGVPRRSRSERYLN